MKFKLRTRTGVVQTPLLQETTTNDIEMGRTPATKGVRAQIQTNLPDQELQDAWKQVFRTQVDTEPLQPLVCLEFRDDVVLNEVHMRKEILTSSQSWRAKLDDQFNRDVLTRVLLIGTSFDKRPGYSHDFDTICNIINHLGYDPQKDAPDKLLQLVGLINPSPTLVEGLDVLTLDEDRFDQSWTYGKVSLVFQPGKFTSADDTKSLHLRSPFVDTIHLAQKSGSIQTLLIVCSNLDLYKDLKDQFPVDSTVIPMTNRNTAGVDFTLARVLHLANIRNRENLRVSARYLHQMTYSVRREATQTKLNYLLHLGDTIQTLARTLRPELSPYATLAASSLSSSASPISSPNASPVATQSIVARHSLVLSQTLDVANEIGKEIDRVYAVTKDQLSHKDSTKNKLFAVVAAIYLPFSLASGILGMNVTGISNETTKWQIFLAIGLPLATMTVALPLSFEQVYRPLRAFIIRNPVTYRRTVVISSAVAIALVIVIVVVIVVLEMVKK